MAIRMLRFLFPHLWHGFAHLELTETDDDAVNWDWTLDSQWTAGDPEWMWEYSGGNAQHLKCVWVANKRIAQMRCTLVFP